MDQIYEVGIVFRGFVLVNHVIKELPAQTTAVNKDLRGMFISAITSFVDSCFKNNNLEYLESKDILFVFKIAPITSKDSNSEEPVVFYGLIEKKKNSDKAVKKFLEKVEPILQSFVAKYNHKDFTELNQFEPFINTIKGFFKE